MGTGPHALDGIAGSAWLEAFHAAPREHFIPDRAWATPMGPGETRWIDRHADPDTWREAVYADTTIATQLDDGATDLAPPNQTQGLPTSSSTAPSLMANFLRLLDPYPGDQVLEIGTGTGWTAALLSAVQGAGQVTSIEVDGQVAAQAKANLDRVGFAPRLLLRDGAEGDPDGAPYDRVHVTCAAREIPYAWVAQTRPGGMIVLPWAPNQAAGHLLLLTAVGEAATGRLLGEASFMPLRAQRFITPHPDAADREATPQIDPRRLTAEPGFGAALAGLLPGVWFMAAHARGAYRLGLRSRESYASVCRPDEPGEAATAIQSGPRDLWTEAEAAYLTWVGWGCPARERFGVTVTPDGQHVWLDHPHRTIQEM